MECPICQDEVYIPVSIICFPCFKRNEIHCHTFTRFCLSCAFQYLSLNVSRLDRPSNVRCVFCEQNVSPRQLTTLNSAIEFDFVLANTLEAKQCPFCFRTVDRIFEHLKECPYMPVQCVCGYVTLRELQKYHKRQCSHFVKCTLCSEMVSRRAFQEHMQETHQFSPCRLCGDMVFNPLHTEHRRSFCEYRKIKCSICHSMVCFKDLESHYQDHVGKLESLLADLENVSAEIRAMLSKIREEIQKYFQPLVLR
mgnify:FL=1